MIPVVGSGLDTAGLVESGSEAGMTAAGLDPEAVAEPSEVGSGTVAPGRDADAAAAIGKAGWGRKNEARETARLPPSDSDPAAFKPAGELLLIR